MALNYLKKVFTLGPSLIFLFLPLQETQRIRTALVHNVKRVFEVVNSLPGVSCQPVDGGAFAFPRLYLPPKAIQTAEVTTLSRTKVYTAESQQYHK